MNINRGYLKENYRLFHSRDRRDMDFQTHSHDFHKIIFCLSGKVTYTMEGTVYALRAWDILLVPEHQIHRSVMSADETYERIVLWIRDDHLKKYGEPALIEPFRSVLRNHRGLLRPDAKHRTVLFERLKELEKHVNSAAPGHALMADTYLIQLLLELNSILHSIDEQDDIIRPAPRMQQLIDYINANPAEDLSIERLARMFYYSPSHLMHAFKSNTGYTVHRYITEKRLLYAADLIMEGKAVSAAAELSGFSDYSTFQKAFRRFFGIAPILWREGRAQKNE